MQEPEFPNALYQIALLHEDKARNTDLLKMTDVRVAHADSAVYYFKRANRFITEKDLKKNEHPLILLGDVNDSGLAVTTRLLSGEPPHRKYPMDVKKEIWDVLLYQAKDIQARRSFEDYYFTHIHNGHHEALDHILVSQELVEENPNHIGRIGYVKVYNDHLVDETQSDDDIPSWESDHGQVVATLELDRRRRVDGKSPKDPV